AAVAQTPSTAQMRTLRAFAMRDRQMPAAVASDVAAFIDVARQICPPPGCDLGSLDIDGARQLREAANKLQFAVDKARGGLRALGFSKPEIDKASRSLRAAGRLYRLLGDYVLPLWEAAGSPTL